MTWDLLIRDCEIFDGSGRTPFQGDIAVEGGVIAAMGKLAPQNAARITNGRGLAVCPGFIDVHAHDDRLILDEPAMSPKVSQGVTSVVVGNCGLSLAPVTRDDLPEPLHQLVGGGERFPTMAAYMAKLEASPGATNVACLVGHTTLRVEAMADITATATADEQAAMAALCRESLDAGAIGLSSGLFYPPAQGADWREVAQLAKLVGAAGGVYTAHIRDEGDRVLEAIDEAVQIAEAGGTPLVISHHKVMGVENFGRSRETLARIDASAAQVDVAFDVYPYVAGASMLHGSILAAAQRVIVTSSVPYPAFAGRDLADIAREWACTELEAINRLKPGTGIYFIMDEADVRRIIAHPMAMIGSDGITGDHPHPRLWGTFPRVISSYARDAKLFSLPEAIRRMTSLPATRFGLSGRGLLAVGNSADLVLFDPEVIGDRATFDDPALPSAGIAMAVVNGVPVWEAGQATGARPGRVLRRQAPAKT